MRKQTMGIVIALLFAALVPVAGAQGSGNVIVQLGVAAAGTEEVVHNEWSLDFGGNGYGSNGNAISNCQFLLGVNTFVLNVVAVDSFGLIDDDDTFEGFPLIGRLGTLERGGGYGPTTTNVTGPCEQHIGAIRVWLETAEGWGEPAPEADALASVASSLGDGIGGGIGGGLNAIVQLGVAAGAVQDVVENEASVYVSGSGNAIANCQILVGFNTLVTNVAVVDQDATIEDSDEVNLTFPGNNGPVITAARTLETTETPSTVDISTSCKQTVESIDLHIGENDVRIPPQS